MSGLVNTMTRKAFIPSFLKKDVFSEFGEEDSSAFFIPSFLRTPKPLKWYDTPSLVEESNPVVNASGMECEDSARPDEPLGLVLSGGGAKGAYQAGVWAALSELGLADRIKAISGTSVGALNAAVFSTIGDAEKIFHFWHYHVGNIVSPNFEALEPVKMISTILSGLIDGEIPLQGLLNREAVGEIVERVLPDKWSARMPDVYATSLEYGGAPFSVSPTKENCRIVRFWLNGEQNAGLRRDKILASCAMPWCFSPVEIRGRCFLDGGWSSKGGDNIPIRPILVRHPEIRTIIVVRCNSADIEPTVLPMMSGVRFIEIRPRHPLRGIFDDFPIEGIPLVQRFSGTLAFDPTYTDAMFAEGKKDGISIMSKVCARGII